MSWLCSCGILNGGLNIDCAGRFTGNLQHKPLTWNEPDELTKLIIYRESGMTFGQLANNPIPAKDAKDEDLFNKLFAVDRERVKNLDTAGLRALRIEMSDIAFRAKVTLLAVDAEERGRLAGLKREQKDWIRSVEAPDPNVTEAIRTVKARGDRISKVDKLSDMMKSLGMEGVDELLNKVSKRQIEGVNVTFTKPNTEAKPDTSSEVKQDEMKPSEDKPNPFANLKR